MTTNLFDHFVMTLLYCKSTYYCISVFVIKWYIIGASLSICNGLTNCFDISTVYIFRSHVANFAIFSLC